MVLLVNEEIGLASAGVCGVSWPSPGPPGLPSGSGLCFPDPSPQQPAMLNREQQPHRAAQVGSWISGHTFPFQGSLITFPQLLAQQPMFRSKGIRDWLWDVVGECPAHSNRIPKAPGPHTLGRAVPYTEEALNQLRPTCQSPTA